MIKVMKFGGTSVSTQVSRETIVNRVKKEIQKGFKPVLVVSAMGRLGDPYATDSLLQLVSASIAPVNPKDLDLLMSCGENISAVVLSSLLNANGLKAMAFTGYQAGILTNDYFGNADVKSVDTTRLLEVLENGFIPVVTGFQGMDDKGNITTLGRGGSDTTAALLGVALNAEEVEIYTDVDGVMTADPRLVPHAKAIDSIAFTEVYQMAIDGAKVVDHKAVSIAMRGNKKLRIRNTFTDSEGTLIQENTDFEAVDYVSGELHFTAFTHKHDIIQVAININGLDERVNEQLLDAFEKNNISMDMINFFTEKKIFTIQANMKERLIAILNDLNIVYDIEEHLSKITAVGHSIHGVPGVMKKIIMALSKAQIGILQTSDSNTTISCLVHTQDATKALNVLHTSFISTI